MGEEIFRKKSLDKVKSPENLDDYIRVSSPGVWLLLISIVVLLIGVCVWSIFGRIDSTVPVTVQVKNGTAVCYVAENKIKGITEGMTVKFSGKEAIIETISAIKNNEYGCTLKINTSLADGFYDGKVVTKSYKPLSFILN